ncbi:alpha/beta hydrolase [Streptosporangium soli]|nr:alpha/beta hydrolase [Streptosporangium sp. KLBMP 9127]
MRKPALASLLALSTLTALTALTGPGTANAATPVLPVSTGTAKAVTPVLPVSTDAKAVTPVLPAPTGDRAVGRSVLHLVDSSRPDPWVAERKARELMVSVWYPARRAVGRPAPYLTPQESALIIQSVPELKDVPPGTLAKTKSYARVDAPALKRKGGWPLVVLSPGMTMPRATMTSLAEEFVSRGYLVAGIEHTYESIGTTFPDGRTVTFEAGKGGQTPELGAKVARVRAADTTFVLDQLERRKHWNRLIDETKVAMVGHSVGGQSAAQLLAVSDRVKAVVNLDGSYNPTTPAKPVEKPFMMIGNPRQEPNAGGEPKSWDLFWPHVTGDWKRWLTVTGAEHTSFVDYAVLQPQLGLPKAPIDGERSIKITRDYVTAFLDLHLKGERRPLLDKPSAEYPEVKFW